ncbi:hypothetical protein ACFVVP_34260 [Streptomyces sp. NPDC058128]|uniref:hypothetical protein n=1 Tax=Streptomyces sp. NPDC058128 TaxID=3346352 RepID=UPI0036EEF775
MGWTVLYIAFGVVALWLLGEVLLQYKARLRWRVLAFCGFLGVVLGVLTSLVAVIVAGAIAFAVGQTYVTLSFRRGFSTGWALGGRPGASRRRRSAAPPQAGPTLEVTELSYEAEEAPYAGPEGADAPSAAESTAVYEPLPLPEDTGQYGVYHLGQDQAHGAAQTSVTGYETGHATGYDPYAPAYDQQQPAYDYGQDAGQQQYAAYSDPYIGPGTDGQQYGSYYGDPYAPSYTYDTPPGGVWVPQQRDTDQPPQTQQQGPGQYGYEQHPDDQQQYRY